MYRFPFFIPVVVIAMILGVSCSGCSERSASDRHSAGHDKEEKSEFVAKALAPKQAKKPNQQNLPPQEKIERKIIYTATIELAVKNIDEIKNKLKKVVKQYDAYVQRADIQGAAGSRRTATWTLRVPVANFDEFREALSKLGETQRAGINSDEVTEEFYDLKKRIENEKKYEERLLELLKVKTESLKDVIQIEEKLAAVREKIEVMEGRLNRLQHRTSFSTVTLTAVERDEYIPEESPSFIVSIGRVFSSSIQVLVDFGKGVVLFLVAITPWLIVILPVAGILWWSARRRRAPSIVETPKNDDGSQSSE